MGVSPVQLMKLVARSRLRSNARAKRPCHEVTRRSGYSEAKNWSSKLVEFSALTVGGSATGDAAIAAGCAAGARYLGGGTNQDVIIACIPSDMLLFESAPHLRVMTDIAADTESKSVGTLSIRCSLKGPTTIALLLPMGLMAMPFLTYFAFSVAAGDTVKRLP